MMSLSFLSSPIKNVYTFFKRSLLSHRMSISNSVCITEVLVTRATKQHPYLICFDTIFVLLSTYVVCIVVTGRQTM